MNEEFFVQLSSPPFLSQVKLVDDHFIQLAIERVKRLILTHSQLLKPSD